VYKNVPNFWATLYVLLFRRSKSDTSLEALPRCPVRSIRGGQYIRICHWRPYTVAFAHLLDGILLLFVELRFPDVM